MTISIVIPALDEEAAIGQTITDIRAAFSQTDVSLEIIVVDDGSTDATGRIAQEHDATVIRHLQSLGYGKSLKDGISAASYDVIGITDADGTYPVEKLPALLEQYQQGYHMVVGERTGPFFRETVIKSPLRRVLKWLVEFTAGRRIPDINSGLRIFSRTEAIKHFDHLCDTFSFTTSLTLAFMMSNKFVLYTPVDYHKRIGHTKVRLFADSLRTLQYISQAVLYYDPLKIFAALSFFCIVLSIMGFVMTLVFSLRSTFFLGVGGLLVAVIVFCCGLLADLLKQIMHKQENPGS
jgi:glycosyltransferase involved in cell wall biosynthesis